eukprot:gene30863-34833_t
MSSKKRVKSESTESLHQSTDKKQKTTEETSNGTLFDLGKLKKVSVSKFKGQMLVNFREYYVDKSTGEEKPGSKGITLNKSQWEEFKKVIPELDAEFGEDE